MDNIKTKKEDVELLEMLVNYYDILNSDFHQMLMAKQLAIRCKDNLYSHKSELIVRTSDS